METFKFSIYLLFLIGAAWVAPPYFVTFLKLPMLVAGLFSTLVSLLLVSILILGRDASNLIVFFVSGFSGVAIFAMASSPFLFLFFWFWSLLINKGLGTIREIKKASHHYLLVRWFVAVFVPSTIVVLMFLWLFVEFTLVNSDSGTVRPFDIFNYKVLMIPILIQFSPLLMWIFIPRILNNKVIKFLLTQK